VAIDSERRVIEDRETDRFVVIVDDTWYCYEPEKAVETTQMGPTNEQRRPSDVPPGKADTGGTTESEQVFDDEPE